MIIATLAAIGEFVGGLAVSPKDRKWSGLPNDQNRTWLLVLYLYCQARKFLKIHVTRNHLGKEYLVLDRKMWLIRTIP